MDPETKIDAPAAGSKRGPGAFLARIGQILVSILFVVASLLTFPSGLPWMILAWVVVACVLVWRNLAPTWLLFGLLFLISIKSPERSWALAALLVACMFSIACYLFGRSEKKPVWPMLILVLVWAIFCLDFWLAATQSTRQAANNFAAIACLGDSLTDYGYPEELQKLILGPVLDYGFDGITSADGLKLIEEILAKKPRLLVLELGGHDYNQGRSRAGTLDNLSQIIQRCQDNQVDVLLIEIPRGFVRDPFRGIERQLARRFDLELISDTMIRQFVLYSPICPPGSWLPPDQHLSRDGLHPNDNGNRLFAQTVARKLAKLLGDEILIDQE